MPGKSGTKMCFTSRSTTPSTHLIPSWSGQRPPTGGEGASGGSCTGSMSTQSPTTCIEAFPYHSCRSPGFPGVLPSQNYSFTMVRHAIEREALILMANTVDWWHDMVPELDRYKHLHIATNPQGGYITPGIYPQVFDQMVSILSDCS